MERSLDAWTMVGLIDRPSSKFGTQRKRRNQSSGQDAAVAAIFPRKSRAKELPRVPQPHE